MIHSSVRFDDAPAHLISSPDNSVNQSDNSDLLDALNINDYSTVSENIGEQDKTVFEDSQYNRINFVGVTPHAKVVQATRDRKVLQELMKIPTFASYNTSSNQADLSNLFSKSAKVASRENRVIEGTENSVMIGKNMNVGNPLQSSTTSFFNKTAANISNTSYHFELFSSSKQIETNHSQSVNNGPSVRFDEKSLLQNKLQTPSINRRKIQKTPIPSKTLLAKSLGSPISEDNDSDGSFSEKKLMNKHDLEASPVPVVREDDSSHSLEISRISHQNDHRNRYESSSMSNSTPNSGASNSPLSALVSRPDVSKSSPIVSSNQFHNKLMDHSTSYSRLSTANSAKKEMKEAATSYSPPAVEKKPHFVDISLPLDNPEAVASHHPISKLTTVATEKSSVSTSLEKICGVAFGKGPVHSKWHHVESDKHISHFVKTTSMIENNPILPEVRVRSISNPDFLLISSSFVEKQENIKEKPVSHEVGTSMDSSHHSFKLNADPIHPATNWYTPRNTRKAPPRSSAKLPFGQNHLQIKRVDDSHQYSENRNNYSNTSELFNELSATLSTAGNKSIQYPSFSSSYSKLAVHGCDVSIQVDSDFLVPNQATVTNQADESCALIELIKPEKEGRSYQQFSHQPNFPYSSSFERKSKALPFDLSTCNIGGTPSTLASSANHNSSTSKLSFASSGFPTPHLLNGNERKGYYYSSPPQNLSFSTTSHSLGSASRIPITIQKDDYRQIIWNEEEKNRRNEISTEYEQSENNSNDYINNDFINEVTFLTDVAVANFTRDNYIEEEQQQDDENVTFSFQKQVSPSGVIDGNSLLSLNPSMYSEGLETTFTVDHSALKKRNNAGFYPRLAIKSLKRDPSSHPFDVKEVGFETSPNELMTVMLSFKNDRQKDYQSIQLISKTIFLRREPLYSHRKNEEMNQLLNDEEKDEVFIVSPEILDIPFNEEGMLFITFAPRHEGIYSGVLQIKYHKKSLTVLLRGESNKEFSLKKTSLSPTQQPLVRSSSQKQVNGHRSAQVREINEHNHLLSSPETLQSYQAALSLSTPPQLTGTATTTPSSETSNEYLNHTPHGFHKKLMVLQQKISEISRKSNFI
jgi:hypothetical protein